MTHSVFTKILAKQVSNEYCTNSAACHKRARRHNEMSSCTFRIVYVSDILVSKLGLFRPPGTVVPGGLMFYC